MFIHLVYPGLKRLCRLCPSWFPRGSLYRSCCSSAWFISSPTRSSALGNIRRQSSNLGRFTPDYHSCQLLKIAVICPYCSSEWLPLPALYNTLWCSYLLSFTTDLVVVSPLGDCLNCPHSSLPHKPIKSTALYGAAALSTKI